MELGKQNGYWAILQRSAYIDNIFYYVWEFISTFINIVLLKHFDESLMNFVKCLFDKNWFDNNDNNTNFAFILKFPKCIFFFMLLWIISLITYLAMFKNKINTRVNLLKSLLLLRDN